MDEKPKQSLVTACKKLSKMGYGPSTSGNCSVKSESTIYLTQTGVALGDAKAAGFAISDLQGRLKNSVKPTKEIGFHLAVYRKRPDVSAVVHVHAAHAVAASVLLPAGKGVFLPSVTPQFVMRAGRVPVLPYYAPGSPAIGAAVDGACDGSAFILQNHGIVVFAGSFLKAIGVLEEVEENCRVWLLAHQQGRLLNDQEIQDLLPIYQKNR
jgi:3-dehydro-4-phosphotetronate decarboxylase